MNQIYRSAGRTRLRKEGVEQVLQCIRSLWDSCAVSPSASVMADCLLGFLPTNAVTAAEGNGTIKTQLPY